MFGFGGSSRNKNMKSRPASQYSLSGRASEISNNNNNIFDSNGVNNNGINSSFGYDRSYRSNVNTGINSNKMGHGIDTVARISELIKHSSDSDGSLDVILNECLKQFNFQSKCDFIAYLFDLSKDKLPFEQCNQLLLSLNGISGINDSNDGIEDIEMQNNYKTKPKAKATTKTRNNNKGTCTQHVHTYGHGHWSQEEEERKQRKQQRVGSSRAHVHAPHSQQTQQTEIRRSGGLGWQEKMQTQAQISKDVKRQQEYVSRVQLLIQSTQDVLSILNEYGERMVKLKMYEKQIKESNNSINYDYNNDEQWNQLRKLSQIGNIKSVSGLQLFEMQFDSFQEKCSELGLSNNIGSKNARKLIEEFLAKMEQSLLVNNNFNDLESGFILDRIDPFTRAMKSVLNGNELPEFKQLANVSFGSQTVNRVLSQVMHTTNHTIPDRVKKVKQNYKEYDMQQRMNVMDMKENGNDKDVSFNDINPLYRDIHSYKLKKQTTFEEIERRAQKDLEKRRNYVFGRPNLLEENDGNSGDGCGSSCDSF